MNRLILLGRLTKDPEIKYLPSGKEVVQFTLAVDKMYAGNNGEKQAMFCPCVLWGKQAVTLSQTVTKGQRLLVEGRLDIRSYEGKDGATKWITECICDRFDYIERKGETTSTSSPMSAFGKATDFDVEVPF